MGFLYVHPPKLEGEDEAILALQEFCFFLDGVVTGGGSKNHFQIHHLEAGDFFPEKKGLRAMTKSGETSENVD